MKRFLAQGSCKLNRLPMAWLTIVVIFLCYHSTEMCSDVELETVFKSYCGFGAGSNDAQALMDKET